MKKLLLLAVAAVTLMAGECVKHDFPFPNPQMAIVLGGTFDMGDASMPGSSPVHKVTLSRYSIGRYQVTQKEWVEVMGVDAVANLWITKGDNIPVTHVSWNDIVGTTGSFMEINDIKYYADGYVYKLNQLTGKKYRLPTEAEWEYAARGGNKSNNYTYSGSNDLDEVAWYRDNSDNKLQPVGIKKANELGIFDMSGNVFEWCVDTYAPYTAEAKTNPLVTGGSNRVLRGGSWSSNVTNAHVSGRYDYAPTFRTSYCGFRLAL